jgi:hypothetical protein
LVRERHPEHVKISVILILYIGVTEWPEGHQSPINGILRVGEMVEGSRLNTGGKGAKGQSVKMGPKKKRKNKKNSSGAQDRARNADDIAPADGPGFAARGTFLLVHPDVAPERPGATVGTCDVDVNARRGLRRDESGGHLWRGGGEGAERECGGTEEQGGEAAAAEGGEHAERENVHF